MKLVSLLLVPYPIPDRPINIIMSARRMKVSKCPSDALTMTNRAVVSPSDFDPKASRKTTIIFVALLMATVTPGDTPTHRGRERPMHTSGCLTDPVAIELLLFVRPYPRGPKCNRFHVAGSGILPVAFLNLDLCPSFPLFQ